MKALVYTARTKCSCTTAPTRALADGEVVLRIDAAGICGSDMHAWHGHDPRRHPGLVLGHEFAATVRAERPRRCGEPGQRVTGNPLITCGRCDYCLQGRDNLCAHRTHGRHDAARRLRRGDEHPRACLIALPATLDPVRRRADRAGGHRAARGQPVDARAGAAAARVPRAGAGRRRHRHAGGAAAAPPGVDLLELAEVQRAAPRVGGATRALRGATRAPAAPTTPSTTSSTPSAAPPRARPRWPPSGPAAWSCTSGCRTGPARSTCAS
jgi:hypothetical protein